MDKNTLKKREFHQVGFKNT